MKPAFLNRYRGWRLSALLTYKMNIFGGKYSIAVLTLQQSLMSRCRSRLLSFFSSRRRRRLGPETFARRIFYWSAEFHVRTSQQPARAIKNVLHANTLSAPKHTDYYDLCVLSLFTGTLNVVNLQLLPNGLLPLQYFSKKKNTSNYRKIYVTRDKSKSKLKKHCQNPKILQQPSSSSTPSRTHRTSRRRNNNRNSTSCHNSRIHTQTLSIYCRPRIEVLSRTSPRGANPSNT